MNQTAQLQHTHADDCTQPELTDHRLECVERTHFRKDDLFEPRAAARTKLQTVTT